MAAIDKMFIHFNRKADFEAILAAGEISDHSIVCIKDAKLIWTHGQYYGELSGAVDDINQQIATKQDKVVIENHDIDDTTPVLTPNVLHRWGEVESLTLTLAAPADATVVNHYMVEFVSGATATTLTMPDSIVWQSELAIEAGKTYQISIVDNLGVIGGW